MASRTLRSLLAALLLCVLVAGASTAASPRKVVLGISALPDRDPATYQEYVTKLGVAPAIWSIWSDWGGSNSGFPSSDLLDALSANRTVPMIFWQPVDPSNLHGGEYTYEKILSGIHDTYIREWAAAAAAWNKQVIVRFAQEMDGGWFPWGVRNNSGNTPALFTAAWQHIWHIFRDAVADGGAGASKVRFLWSPLNPCTCRADLYPGAEYVDYVGFTAFNWGPPVSQTWHNLKILYQRKVRHLATLAPGKPIIVAETGSNPTGGNRTVWIRSGYPAVYVAFPTIKAIVYFDVDMRGQGQPDWRLKGRALDAYKNLLLRTEFTGRLK